MATKNSWPGVPLLPTWEQFDLPPKQKVLLDKTRQLVQIFATRAATLDKERLFPTENFMDLHREGILAAAIPETFGGSNCDYRVGALIIEEVARACASTAWLMMIHFGFVYMLPTLLGDAAAPIFEQMVSKGATAAGVTNIVTLQVEPVEEGYCVNGRARFCGGGEHATWLSLPAKVPGHIDQDGSHVRVMWFDAKRSGVKVDDNWDTMSLRASRSVDLILENVVVRYDETYLYSPESPPSVHLVPRPYPGIWQALFLQNALFLGIAQGSFDWVAAHVQSRGMRRDNDVGRSSSTISRLPGVQFTIADSASTLWATRRMLYDQLVKIEKSDRQTLAISASDGIEQDLTALFTAESTVRVVNQLFHIIGGEAVFARNPIERALRDIQIARLADGNQPFRLREKIGKYYLNIPADAIPRWG